MESNEFRTKCDEMLNVTDEEGNVVGGKWVAEVKMAPDDAVTREQVAAARGLTSEDVKG